ncbi:hypothetical protein Patl1_28456 [Pistacia atlantica]|uniref:Uncharacterized protein n=1 Tax=Pistacia atlantica TaxID=434234 RepID=A0ACC1BC64_9ROSI|nr:hypothetical protein Patl1_28456 [Pistacia atlantica]
MGRAPCCDKANVKKGPWSPEEDAKLKAYIEEHGHRRQLDSFTAEDRTEKMWQELSAQVVKLSPSQH